MLLASQMNIKVGSVCPNSPLWLKVNRWPSPAATSSAPARPKVCPPVLLCLCAHTCAHFILSPLRAPRTQTGDVDAHRDIKQRRQPSAHKCTHARPNTHKHASIVLALISCLAHTCLAPRATLTSYPPHSPAGRSLGADVDHRFTNREWKK